MDFTTGSEKTVLGQWTFECTVEFVDLPPNLEDGYWNTLRLFADFITKELTAPPSKEEAVNTQGSSGVLHV